MALQNGWSTRRSWNWEYVCLFVCCQGHQKDMVLGFGFNLTRRDSARSINGRMPSSREMARFTQQGHRFRPVPRSRLRGAPW